MEGTTSYVSHLVFRPLMSTDTAVLGRVTSLEAIPAYCGALDVASGDEKSIGGVCVLTDSDGDKIFSTFETRDIDKSQPKMVCNTHMISAGTGKYNGIAESRICLYNHTSTDWSRRPNCDGHFAQHDAGEQMIGD